MQSIKSLLRISALAVTLILLLTGSIFAQIPQINLSKKELLRRVEANTQDVRHFDALADLIVKMATEARSGTNDVYPEYDPTRPILPHLESLTDLGEELGGIYPSRAKIIELHMNAMACPNLSPEEREKIAPFYHSIRDSLGTSGEPQNLELRLHLYGAIYFRCLAKAFPHEEQIEVAEALYTEPGLLDSQRIELSLFLILSHFTVGDRERGNEIIRQVLRTAEETPGAHRSKVKFYTMMADFFQQFTGDYEKGAELLELAQEHLAQMDPAYSGFSNKASYMLIQAYKKLGRYDQALAVHNAQAALEKTQNSNKKLTDREHLTDLTVRLEFCRKTSDTSCQLQAQRLLDGIALVENKEGSQGYNDKDLAYAQAGLYYYDLEDFEKARPYLKNVVKTILESRFYDRDFGSEVLRAYLKTSGDQTSKQQLQNIYDKLYRWKDRAVEIAQENSESKAAFELGVSENKLAKQRAEQQTLIAEQETASNRRFYTILLGALASLLAIIGFSFYRSQRDGKRILAQKALVDQSLSEKEVLLREIHHRVKNNLQIISGLLQTQADIADDEHVSRLVTEGQERIQSMALIHQNLYQSENLAGVNIKSYLQDLSDNISRSYAENKDIIQLDLQVDDEHLDIDTAIPIGLILNELITNAYKYAFPVGEAGKVIVQFTKKAEKFLLRVSDDGVGLPSDHEIRQSNSLGINLVKGLVRQLDGTIEWRKEVPGTEVSIVF